MQDYARLLEAVCLDTPFSSSEEPFVASDSTRRGVAGRSLRESLLKKLAPNGDTSEADERALRKFLSVNYSLPLKFDFNAENEAESCFWDYFRHHLNALLGPRFPGEAMTADGFDVSTFDIACIREGMGVGPGRAIGAYSVDFVGKLFLSKLTYTHPELIRLYHGALSETGMWHAAEAARVAEYGFERVDGGRVFFAAKNAEISRTCCTEPSLNMIIQKGVDWFITQRLALDGVILRQMPVVNQRLAKIGSMDGSFATLDQTSASDCTGLSMLDQALDTGLLKRTIWWSRCPVVTLPGGETVDTRMVSTMGNGFTFSLLSAIGVSAIKAVYDLHGIKAMPGRNFGVFGDDICCLTSSASFLSRMLGKLGYIVNSEKSFTVGPFRESCGHDYFQGYQVRGVYCKSAETESEIYSLMNRLGRWSAFHGIPLQRTMLLLRSWLPKRVLRVPISESDDAGLHVPFCMTRPKLDNRYWFKYRYLSKKKKAARYRVVSDDYPGHMLSDHAAVLDVMLGAAILGGYTAVDTSRIHTIGPSGYVEDPCHHGRLSFFDVPTRNDRDECCYQIRSRFTPFWDYVPIVTLSERHLGAHDVRHGPRASGPDYVFKTIEDDSGYRLTPVMHEAWKAFMQGLAI
jgi:hypothetical protein